MTKAAQRPQPWLTMAPSARTLPRTSEDPGSWLAIRSSADPVGPMPFAEIRRGRAPSSDRSVLIRGMTAMTDDIADGVHNGPDKRP